MWWPLFPLLLLLVIVCLTWALVIAVRGHADTRAKWLQLGAFACYVIAAVSGWPANVGLSQPIFIAPFHWRRNSACCSPWFTTGSLRNDHYAG